MKFRKGRITLGKRGMRATGPRLRFGGKRSGFNLSKSGLSYSTRIGKFNLNSKRGCTMPVGILAFLILLVGFFGQPALAATHSAPRADVGQVEFQARHVFYASAKAKKYYYCDDDPQWKDLSPKYLLKFNSEAEAKAKTQMVLHRPCKN